MNCIAILAIYKKTEIIMFNKIKNKIKKVGIVRILGHSLCISAGLIAGVAILGVNGLIFGALFGALFGILLEKGIQRIPAKF